MKKGDVVALTVPIVGAGAGARLRQRHLLARQPPEERLHQHQRQTTQTTVGSAVQYYCLYQTARLTYSATLISTP